VSQWFPTIGAIAALWLFASGAPLSVANGATSVTPGSAGLCVRTARDGYVVLEARLIRSSGDAQFDSEVLADIVGRAVPIPNQRMWFEWLSLQVHRPGASGSPKTFNCAELDSTARAKAAEESER